MRTYARTLTITLLALGVTAPFVFAQVAAPAKSPSPDRSSTQSDADVTKLSPFQVSTDQDTGYIAADTLNAGLLNSKLLMTPGNIDVLTRDFLDDLGAFNSDAATVWLTSSRPLELGAVEGNSLNPGSLAQSDSGTNVSLRGVGANPSTRNYFTSGSTPKEYNVERVESSRGPNAILYGEGGPGGGLNYITKRAKSRNFGELRLRYDDNSSKSASLDLNRKITNNLDARYNVNVLDQRYYLDRTDFREVDHALTATYRPFERTSITVDADYTRNSRPGLILAYGEQYAKWDHVGVASKTITPNPGQTLAATLTNRGLATWGGAKNLIWVDGIGMQDYAGYVHTAGYGLPQPTEARYGDSYFPSLTQNTPGITALPTLPQKFNANPQDINVNDRSKDFQLAFDHTFENKISMQLAGQYSKLTTNGGNYYFTTIYLDALTNLPDGRVNPNYNKPYANSYVGRKIDYERDSRTVRFLTAYPLTLWGSTTNFSVFLSHQQKNDKTIYTDLHIVDPTSTLPITDASSQIHVDRYFDNLSEKLPDFRSMYNTIDVPVADGRNQQKLQAVEIAASGNYLHDTLAVIAGVRRDLSELTVLNGGTRDNTTGAYTSYTTDTRKAYNNTLTAGFVYFPIKPVGIYANHGEGFIIQTAAAPHLDGTLAKANIVPAKERSAGLRFNLGGNDKVQVVGSIGYYHAEQENLSYPVLVGGINTLYRDLGTFQGKDYSGSYIKTLSSDPFTTASTNAITSFRNVDATGWEASFTANVGHSFRLTLNGALPKVKQTGVAADYVAYVNKIFPTFSSLATNAANPNAAADVVLVNQLTQALTGFMDNREQNLTYKYRYNLFGIYTFSWKPIKGLRVGGGANIYGHSLIGNQINQAYNYVYDKEYYIVSGQLGYPIKLGKYRMDVQLNIDNLFDYDKSVYSGLFVATVNSASVNVPYGTKYVFPRSARLTLTVPF